MMHFFWTHGRLSWPLVVCVAYVTVSIVVFDLVWRTVNIPFGALVTYALLAVGTLAGLAVILYQFTRRPQ